MAKLSTFKTQYLEAIKAEIDEIFPEDRSGTSISDLDIFDHRLFNSLSDAEIKRKIKTAAKFIGYTNLPKLYVDEYLNLVKKIKQDPIGKVYVFHLLIRKFEKFIISICQFLQFFPCD